jgi:hypothetical protein
VPPIRPRKKENQLFALFYNWKSTVVVWPTCWTYIGDKKEQDGLFCSYSFLLVRFVFGGRLMLSLSLNHIVASHQLKNMVNGTEKTSYF